MLLEAVAVRSQALSERVLGEILRLLHEAPSGGALELSALKALSAHGSPELLLPWFEARTELSVLLLIGSALRRLEPGRRWQLLSGWLRGPADPRSRLAAELLVGCAPGPAEEVAVAVRSGTAGPLFEAAPRAWLEALRGPYREQARRLLAPETLAARFAELEVADRLWLLSSGVTPHAEWLHPQQDGAVLCQLMTVLPVPSWALAHPDASVRAKALHGCQDADERWPAERDPEVQAVLARRLDACLGEALRSLEWRVRAAAARRAAELGRVETLREVALEPGPAQVAAVNALHWLGDDEWLQRLARANSPEQRVEDCPESGPKPPACDSSSPS